MSTPPKATPTTPQWAIEAAKAAFNCPCFSSNPEIVIQEWAKEILKHAPPPAAQPSDAAGLREVIESGIELFNHATWRLDASDRISLTDHLISKLAPYLKGEPGDSELLKECRELRVMLYATSTGMRGYHDDGELQDNREHPFIDFKRDSVEEIQRKNLERNARHLSAMRGERGAE